MKLFPSKLRSRAHTGFSLIFCLIRFQRDGSGCDFWYWEEEYEQMLMDRGYMPPNYQAVFSRTEGLLLSSPLVLNRTEALEALPDLVLHMDSRTEIAVQGCEETRHPFGPVMPPITS